MSDRRNGQITDEGTFCDTPFSRETACARFSSSISETGLAFQPHNYRNDSSIVRH